VGPEARRLWRFSSTGDEARLEGQGTHPNGQPLPAGVVRKDWRALWQTKLNIACLPEENLYLRVLQLPAESAAEIAPMVELQLEKLSPIPVAQVVWSLEVVPSSVIGQITCVVIIAERKSVEEFLGVLEADSYIADRLELPLLHQMLATPSQGDGVWLHFSRGELVTTVLAAWRANGELRHVNLLRLPQHDQAAQVLTDQLAQHAWAGEAEGWFQPGCRWHLVAERKIAAQWEPALAQWTSGNLQTLEAPPFEKVAASTAAHAGASTSSLLPPEHALKYRQQFIDGLWMRGLFAIAGAYVVGVVIYFAALQVMEMKKNRLAKEVATLHAPYVDVLQLKDRIRVLQEQVDLRFAALDCWKAVCDQLPSELALTEMTFSRGLTLGLNGTVSSDDQAKVTEFNGALRRLQVGGEPLFDKDHFDAPTFMPQAGGGYRWTFKCDLKRGEVD
jgi:hypothetical protein